MKYLSKILTNKVKALIPNIMRRGLLKKHLTLFIALGLLVLPACDSSSPTSPENTVPVAVAGKDQTLDVGTVVSLDANTSRDADGDDLTFTWAFTSMPEGSAVTLSNANTATPSFTPDAAGIYKIELTVSDGTESATDQVAVTARVPFKSWEQSFENGTESWLTNATSGAAGWCGSIERHGSSGIVAPSAGQGYAVVTHGTCNAYWSSNGFPNGSGPYSAGAGYSAAWPKSGYVMQLDVYLDPRWSADFDGSVFTYSVNMRLLNKEYPNNFRYFFVPVTVEEGRLLVAGNEITEAGWYTFRHRFSSEGEDLAVNFELVRDGQAVFTKPVTETSLSGEATSSFTASNVSNGYVWFVSIAEDLGVAIDEHQVRRAE